MERQDYFQPEDRYQFGRLWVNNKADGTPTLILAGKILHPNGFEDRLFLPRSNHGQAEATVDFARDGNGNVVVTYRTPKAEVEGADANTPVIFLEVTVTLTGLNQGQKGFIVFGPTEVTEGTDNFSVASVFIGTLIFILCVILAFGFFGSVINGY